MSFRLLAPVLRPTCSCMAGRRIAQVSRHMSAEAGSDAEPQVTHGVQDGLRYLTLNRPKALNALNTDMIRAMKKLIDSWERSPDTQAIVIEGRGRAFCAGGDVVNCVKAAQDPQQRHLAISFFQEEYDLDQQLAHLEKPAIAILDGITMGGGVGISVHLPFRIVTENTVFSMPETTIGLFPDVGVTFFLSRMDGQVGTYLGLTSERLGGYAAYAAGLGTHFIPAGNLDFVRQRLLDLSRKPSATTELASLSYSDIDGVLEEFAADASFLREQAAKNPPISGVKRRAIDHCFNYQSAEDIITQLRRIEEGKSKTFRDSGLEGWAKETADTILKRSPTSVKVTLKALRDAKGKGINDVFKTDMQLAATFCTPSVTPDFVTGVTHLLINKQRDTRADWSPAQLTDIANSEIAQTFFGRSPAPGVQVPVLAEASRQRDNNWQQYPAGIRGLPSEQSIRALIEGTAKGSGSFASTEEEILTKLQAMYERATGKIGLKEKLDEVVTRMCKRNRDGTLSWDTEKEK